LPSATVAMTCSVVGLRESKVRPEADEHAGHRSTIDDAWRATCRANSHMQPTS
jgi:hypothetical protein